MTTLNFNIKEAIEAVKADAYLMTGNIHNSDIYYVTHFLASDEFTYIQTKKGNEILFISQMEKGRAEIESRVSNIKTTQDLGYRKKIKEKKNVSLAYAACISELLLEDGAKRISVPYDFPIFYSEFLKNSGFSNIPITSPFKE